MNVPFDVADFEAAGFTAQEVKAGWGHACHTRKDWAHRAAT